MIKWDLKETGYEG